MDVFDDGFVQQHVLTGVGADGTRVTMFGPLVIRLREGRATRLDEYLDSAEVTEFYRVYQLANRK